MLLDISKDISNRSVASINKSILSSMSHYPLISCTPRWFRNWCWFLTMGSGGSQWPSHFPRRWCWSWRVCLDIWTSCIGWKWRAMQVSTCARSPISCTIPSHVLTPHYLFWPCCWLLLTLLKTIIWFFLPGGHMLLPLLQEILHCPQLPHCWPWVEPIGLLCSLPEAEVLLLQQPVLCIASEAHHGSDTTPWWLFMYDFVSHISFLIQLSSSSSYLLHCQWHCHIHMMYY